MAQHSNTEKQTTKREGQTTNKGRSPYLDVLSRIKSLYALLIFCGICVIVRMAWIMVISPSVRHNADVMERGIFRTKEVEAHRGTIFSRDGEPLAISSLRYNILLDFGSEGMIEADEAAYSKRVDSLSKLLAAHFDKEDARLNNYTYRSAADYRKILIEERTREKKRRAHKIMPRSITVEEWGEMKRYYPILNGDMGYVFSVQPNDKRLYPSGDIARQTIGRYDTLVVNDKKVAGAGLEYLFNHHLKGEDGVATEQWIAHGFWARVKGSDDREVVNGANVITTIDAGLQRVAHERLDTMLRRNKASFGVAMVMEVQTGNILCMVSLGSAKERGTTYSERVNNHALKTAISPGSTMKLATAMALLEIGDFDIDTQINTEHSRPGHSVKIGDANVTDTHDAAGADSDGNVSLKDAFAHSSNVYFAKAVYETFKRDPAKYTDFLAKLRFNDYIGIEEYGEVSGRIAMANTPEWNQRGSTSSRLPRLAYGYEMDIPPIHMLTFYNGVANEGRMVAPRFVDRIERDGEVVERMPVVTLIKSMCSKSTLAQLDTCLAAASLRTGRHFKDLAIPFGCKTGTAQVWSTFVSDSRLDYEAMKNGLDRNDNYYYGSIVCTMPQENPKYTIMVGVCRQLTADNSHHYGIDLSAPVAADMMEYLYAIDHTLHSEVERPEKSFSPVSIKGGKSEYVETIGDMVDAKDNTTRGDAWSRLAFDEEAGATINAVAIQEGRVPDVRGMGLTDALYLLESAGLRVTHSGSGRVKSQSLQPGYKIGTNTTINLLLER